MTNIVDKLFAKKQNLADLIDRKIGLINNLIDLEKQISLLLAVDGKNWTVGFPIESLKDLSAGSNLKTRLGDFNTRAKLKKICLQNLEELDSLDDLIKISFLELVIEKVNLAINVQN